MIDYGGIKLNIKTNADKTADKLLKCADAFDKLKKSASGVKEDVGQIVAPTKTATVSNVEIMGDALAKVGSKADTTTGQIDKTKKKVSDLGKEAKHNSGALGKLTKSLGRIALYRALRSVISGITNAIKSGLTYIKEYSKAVEGTDTLNANGTINTYLNSFEKIKAEIGASFLPVLKSLVPLFKSLTEGATELFKSITIYSTSKLTGNGEYTFINPEYWDNLSDQFSVTEENAKKLNRQLMKFDELNVINSDSNSQAFKDYAKYFTTLTATNDEIEQAKENVLAMETIFGAIGGAIAGFKVGGLKGSIIGAILGVPGSYAVSGDLGDGLENLLEKLTKANEKMHEWIDNLKDASLFVKILVAPIVGLFTGVEMLFSPVSGLGKAIKDFGEDFKTIATVVGYVLKNLNEIGTYVATKLGKAFGTFLADLVNNAEKIKDTIAGIFYRLGASFFESINVGGVFNGIITNLAGKYNDIVAKYQKTESAGHYNSWDVGSLSDLNQSKFGIPTNPSTITIVLDDSANLVKNINGASTKKIQRTGAIGLMETAMA